MLFPRMNTTTTPVSYYWQRKYLGVPVMQVVHEHSARSLTIVPCMVSTFRRDMDAVIRDSLKRWIVLTTMMTSVPLVTANTVVSALSHSTGLGYRTEIAYLSSYRHLSHARRLFWIIYHCSLRVYDSKLVRMRSLFFKWTIQLRSEPHKVLRSSKILFLWLTGRTHEMKMPICLIHRLSRFCSLFTADIKTWSSCAVTLLWDTRRCYW